MRLETRESRRRWEKAFCSEILVPVITVRTLKIERFLFVCVANSFITYDLYTYD